jgi:hypothetical protein
MPLPLAEGNGEAGVYQTPRIILGGWQLSAGHHEGFDQRKALRDLDSSISRGFIALDMGDIYTGVEVRT